LFVDFFGWWCFFADFGAFDSSLGAGALSAGGL